MSVNGTMQAWGERADGNPLLAFVDSCLRGVGQVCFMNNPVTGLAILIAMFVAEAWLGFAGVLGVVASTATAAAIGMDRGAIRAGLFGFNGVLVGAGLSLFLQPDWDEHGDRLDRRDRGVLDDPARRPGEGVHRLLHRSAVHAGVQLHDAALPDRRAELRQRPGRRPGRAGRRAGHRGLGQQHAALRRRGGAAPTTSKASSTRSSAASASCSSPTASGRGSSSSRASPCARGSRRSSRVVGSAVGMLTGLALGANGVAIYNGLWGFNSFDACARRRRRVLRPVVAVGRPRGRLRGARGDAVRRDRHALHPVGPPRPDAALLLRDAGLRPAEGVLDQARAGRGRGHHDARGAPRPLARRRHRPGARPSRPDQVNDRSGGVGSCRRICSRWTTPRSSPTRSTSGTTAGTRTSRRRSASSRATCSGPTAASGSTARSRTTTPPRTSATRRCPACTSSAGPFHVEGAEPGDLLVVDILEIDACDQEDEGPLSGMGWGYTGVFAKTNGGGFLTERFPDAYKVIWDFTGDVATSRHIPECSYVGIHHPGLMGTAPSAELLAKWTKRETDLIATDPDRVPPLALPPLPDSAILGIARGRRVRPRRRRGRPHRPAARERRQPGHQELHRRDAGLLPGLRRRARSCPSATCTSRRATARSRSAARSRWAGSWTCTST